MAGSRAKGRGGGKSGRGGRGGAGRGGRAVVDVDTGLDATQAIVRRWKKSRQ